MRLWAGILVLYSFLFFNFWHFIFSISLLYTIISLILNPMIGEGEGVILFYFFWSLDFMVSSITKVHISRNSQVRPSNRETHTQRQRLNKIQNKVSFILRCLLETIVFNSAIISILLFLVNFTLLPPHLGRLAQITIWWAFP